MRSVLTGAAAFSAAMVVSTVCFGASPRNLPERSVYRAPTGLFADRGTFTFPYSTGFEPAEGFMLGPVDSQQDWVAFSLTNSQPVVSNADPHAGTQHLRQSRVAGQPNASFVGAFSPLLSNVADNTSSRSSYRFKANNVTPGPSGGAEYIMAAQEGQNPTDEITWQVNFSFQGDILVADNTDADPDLESVDTGLNWVAGQYFTVDVDLDIAANSVRYYVNGALAHTSVGGVFAGTSVRQVVLLSDNFFALNENGNYDTVSITAIPEPASFGLLGALGAVVLRRRSR
jgi:hypothetical protein